MGFETARKPASSPPRRPARPPSASWLLSTEFGRSRWGGWVDGWRRRKKRIGRGTGKPASASLSLSLSSLSPSLLSSSTRWRRRMDAAAARRLPHLCFSLSRVACRAFTHISQPSFRPGRRRRQKAVVVGSGESRPGARGRGRQRERERETETGSAQETVVVLRKETAAAARRRRPRGEAGVGGRRSQKGQ